jgi:hypothetical protein
LLIETIFRGRSIFDCRELRVKHCVLPQCGSCGARMIHGAGSGRRDISRSQISHVCLRLRKSN